MPKHSGRLEQNSSTDAPPVSSVLAKSCGRKSGQSLGRSHPRSPVFKKVFLDKTWPASGL